MLRHVRGQKETVKSIERRIVRKKQHPQAGKKSNESQRIMLIAQQAAAAQPTAYVNSGTDQQEENEPSIDRPRLKCG
jgi:hypothetical protein